jgi:AcrR family transcriptional regulator
VSAEVSSARPYATLLAKGEDRKQRILAVAERLLARNGWRNTSLAQIAKEAGVTPAGLLHHFESKEQLLNAVLDARDADDDAHADRSTGDLVTEIRRVAERFDRAPELIGTFTVLLVENILPDAPLHDRLLTRYRDAVDIVAQIIRRGQSTGRYRADVDAAAKAIEILAFVTGMETTWLLDPSIPLAEVFKAYAESLAHQLETTT